MLPHRFKKTRLSQLFAAGIIAGLGSSAFAGDFVLNNNQITWVSTGTLTNTSTATIAETGVAETVNLLRGNDASALPNVSFTLEDLADTTGTYYIRLFMQVANQSSSNQVEMRLGVVQVAVNAGEVTSAQMITNQADPNYAPVDVYARKSSGGSTVNLNAQFATIAGMVTGSGNEVTVNVNNVVSALSGNNNLFDDIIERFASAGTFDYIIGINDDSANNGRIGTNDGGAFTVSPVAAPNFDLNPGFGAEFANATYVKGTLEIVNALPAPPSSGGDPDPGEDDDPVDVVDDEDIAELDEDAEELETTVDSEIDSGTVSDNTVTQTQNTTNTAISQSNALVNADTTVTQSNIIDVIQTTSKVAKTAGKVAGATTSPTGSTLSTQAKTILDNSAAALESLANRNANETDPLNSFEIEKLQGSLQNLSETTAEVAETAGTVNDIETLKTSLNKTLRAAEKLQTPIPTAVMDTIKSASVRMQIATLKVELGLSETPTEEELTSAFNNPATKAKILKNTPTLPNANPVSESEARANMLAYIRDNRPDLDLDDGGATDAAVAGAIASSTAAAVAAGSAAASAAGAAAGAAAGLSVGGPASGGISGFSALNDMTSRTLTVLAAEGDDSVVTTDESTGTMTFKLAGTTFKVRPLAVKAVPDGVNASIDMLSDGRVVIISEEGVALEVAPTSIDLISFAYKVESMAFPLTLREDGSFELALAGEDKFTGTFTYEDASSSSTEACSDATFAADANPVNSPSYAFTMTCENGETQRIVPFVADSNFYESVDDADIAVTTDRNTGIISVNGIGLFKPDFFSTAPNDAEAEFQAQNADSNGIAYMPTDANGDGRMDYKIISESRVQIMYAVP